MSTKNEFDSTYSVLEAIYNKLKSGGGLDVDFGSIYSQEMIDSVTQQLNDDIAYTKSKEKPPTNDVSNFYKNDTKLVYAPQYFSDGSVFGGSVVMGVYSGCTELRYVPMIDTSNAANMNSMFNGCSSLTTIPQLDTSKATNMSYMFQGCSSLTEIPQLDTSKVTTMSGMFSDCSSLTTIPQLDTSKVTTMSDMFGYCYNLSVVPSLDTSNVTTMYRMFYGCRSLSVVPSLDTSNVTTTYSMFSDCSSLKTIPQLNTSNVTDMDSMFYSCESLTSIPLLDAGKVTKISSILGGGVSSSTTNLTDFGGLKDLGKSFTSSQTLYLLYCTSLTHESLMNVINNLYDLNLNGKGGKLTLGTTNLNKLTPDEIAIATNKGWTVS